MEKKQYMPPNRTWCHCSHSVLGTLLFYASRVSRLIVVFLDDGIAGDFFASDFIFSFWMHVLVSCGCCNKLLPTLQLKQQKLRLPVVVSRSLESVSLVWHQGVSKAVLFSEVHRETPFLASSSFSWLEAFLGFTPVSTSTVTLPSPLQSVSNRPLFKDTCDCL